MRWEGVKEASIYRVAVFASPDEEGKRELMAAVWVKGLSWPYGSDRVLPKAGKLPSTQAKPLSPGSAYKVMVSAARENGADKSDWSSAEFVAAGAPSSTPPSPSPWPTPSPTPLSQAVDAADAEGGSASAEIEVDLAAEFRETPEAGEEGLASGAPEATLEGARSLLQQGKSEDAEAAYRALLGKDEANADLWEGLGDSYDARKMKVEAKEAYERALGIDKKRERLKRWLEENVKR
jgi:tetratricopeptide (TPR) repeat protein